MIPWNVSCISIHQIVTSPFLNLKNHVLVPEVFASMSPNSPLLEEFSSYFHPKSIAGAATGWYRALCGRLVGPGRGLWKADIVWTAPISAAHIWHHCSCGFQGHRVLRTDPQLSPREGLKLTLSLLNTPQSVSRRDCARPAKRSMCIKCYRLWQVFLLRNESILWILTK